MQVTQGPGVSPGGTGQTGGSVEYATGDVWQSFTDSEIAGGGPGLDLTRTYSSGNASTEGIFGFAWSSSYDMHLTVNGDGPVTITEEDGSQVTATPSGGGSYSTPSWADSTLTQNGDGTWTFVRHQTETFTFSADGQLVSISDPNGYATTLAYNASGQLATVTGSPGRQLTFSFGSNGLVSSVVDPLGRTTEYTYDSGRDLVSVKNPGGGTWSFTYGPGHLMLTMTDPDGGTVTNAYDGGGRVTSQTDPMGRTTTFAYSGDNFSNAGGTTTITDPRGIIETQHYAGGLLMSLTEAAGTASAATWSYTYDPVTHGRLFVTDPNGKTSHYTYDSDGNVLSSTDALGNTTTYTYNSLNEPTSVTGPSGVTTTYTYDAKGNLTGTSRPLTGTSQYQTALYTYGDPTHPDDPTASTGSDGDVTTFAYDADGDLISSTDPDGDTTTYTYDADGEKTSMVSPNGNIAGGDPAKYTTSYTYDALGDLLTSTGPLGGTTTYTYDGDRDQTSVTDPDGHTTTYTYDADSERTTTTEPDGTKLTTSYDADGNVTSQTDADSNKTTYSYNLLNQQVSSTDPLGRVTNWAYDGDGNLLTEVNPVGVTSTYTYDADGELTGVSYSDATTPTINYQYDDLGQRTAMTDATGTTTYRYDSLGRLTSSTDGAGQTTTYTYDLDGHVTTLGYPSGDDVNYVYDAAGRLVSVTDWLGHTTGYTYDADGNVLDQANANGTTAASAYDATDRLVSITDTNSSGPFATYNYTRDADGLITQAVTTGIGAANETYGYDALGRLTQVNTANLRYDGAGNLTTTEDGTTQTYNADNELTSPGYTYDAEGNQVTGYTSDGAPATYLYNAANSLTALDAGSPGTSVPEVPFIVLLPSCGLLIFGLYWLGRRRKWRGAAAPVVVVVLVMSCAVVVQHPTTASASPSVTANYAYNGDGLRLVKTVNGVTHTFAWDTVANPALLLEDSTDGGTTSYVYGLGDSPIEQITGATATWLLHDQFGSVRVLTDQHGSVVGSVTYDAYGTPTWTGQTSAFGFAGEYTDDESGLVYLRSRYYDPTTARFFSVQPPLLLTSAPNTSPGFNETGSLVQSGPGDYMGTGVTATNTLLPNQTTGDNIPGEVEPTLAEPLSSSIVNANSPAAAASAAAGGAAAATGATTTTAAPTAVITGAPSGELTTPASYFATDVTNQLVTSWSVDPSSALALSTLLGNSNISTWVNEDRPIFIVPSNQPEQLMAEGTPSNGQNWCATSFSDNDADAAVPPVGNFDSIFYAPVPSDVYYSSASTDDEVAIIQTSNPPQEYDFWGFGEGGTPSGSGDQTYPGKILDPFYSSGSQNPDNDVWDVGNGGQLTTTVNPPDFPGGCQASASGLSEGATTITEQDVYDAENYPSQTGGGIDHALSLEVPYNLCDGDKWPATDPYPDCSQSGEVLAEGDYFRLSSTANCDALQNDGSPPLAYMVCYALQNYGMIIMDRNTEPQGTIILEGEDPADWVTEGHSGTDPLTSSLGSAGQGGALSQVPWSDLQLVDPPAH